MPVHSQAPPDPQVVARPKRRHFGQDYKRRILREDAACTEPGQIGALLRREGLYSSHLVDWRRQEQAQAGSPKPPSVRLAEQNRRLRRENARLERRLAQAYVVIDLQKESRSCCGSPWRRPRATGASDGGRH